MNRHSFGDGSLANSLGFQNQHRLVPRQSTQSTVRSLSPRERDRDRNRERDSVPMQSLALQPLDQSTLQQRENQNLSLNQSLNQTRRSVSPGSVTGDAGTRKTGARFRIPQASMRGTFPSPNPKRASGRGVYGGRDDSFQTFQRDEDRENGRRQTLQNVSPIRPTDRTVVGAPSFLNDLSFRPSVGHASRASGGSEVGILDLQPRNLTFGGSRTYGSPQGREQSSRRWQADEEESGVRNVHEEKSHILEPDIHGPRSVTVYGFPAAELTAVHRKFAHYGRVEGSQAQRNCLRITYAEDGAAARAMQEDGQWMMTANSAPFLIGVKPSDRVGMPPDGSAHGFGLTGGRRTGHSFGTYIPLNETSAVEKRVVAKDSSVFTRFVSFWLQGW